LIWCLVFRLVIFRSMCENIVSNLLVSMQGKKDDGILKQLEDSDFIDTITDMLEEVEFNNES